MNLEKTRLLIILSLVVGVLVTVGVYEYIVIPNRLDERDAFLRAYADYLMEHPDHPLHTSDIVKNGITGLYPQTPKTYSVYNDNDMYKVFEGHYPDDWFPSEDDVSIFNSTNCGKAIQWAIDNIR